MNMNMNNTTKMTTIDTAIVSYLNDYHDVNRLFYKGSLFNPHNKSYYGYRLDVLKSALQKYLRRKELKKMEWVMTELYMFRFADSRAMGVLSNVLNRVKIFNDEEMCFVDWNRYLKVHELIEEFEKNDKVGLNILLKICKILVDCKMLRLNSDIKCYYILCVDKYGLKLKDAEVNEGKVLRYVKEGDDKECLDLFGKFIDLFEKGSEDCCYYALKLIEKEEKNKVKCGRRIRRTGPSYMIWDYLLSVGRKKNNKDIINVMEYRLKEYHKKRHERPIFMTACIYMMIYYDDIDWNQEIDYSKYDVSDQDVINMLNERVKLDIDDYCIDMHCSEGRKKGKNKRDFVLEGCVVVDEYTKYSRPEMRKLYIEIGLDHAKKVESGELPAKGRRGKKKKNIKDMLVKKVKKEIKKEENNEKEIKKEENKEIKKESKMTDRARLRSEKYKKIKKMRGVPNFDDLEKDLEFVDYRGIDVNKIRLCTENTCGNKVMCFEYEGKIWKEGRKSMNYNRDYCVLDECKEMFGLEKIGMKRVLSNFRIEKVDKSKKSWVENWHKVIKDGGEKVVYCVMDKINPGIEVGKRKKEMLSNRKMLKEFVKIGVFRGIFRASDFNGRNVLIKEGDKLVSIDEGDIGKRLDIIGGREKWLIGALNKDKSIIKEILSELISIELPLVRSIPIIDEMMKKYKFSDELVREVCKNLKNLKNDLEKEGVEFE